jgi:hypothetical protein
MFLKLIGYTKDYATKRIQPNQVLTFWRLDLRSLELAGRLPWLAFFLACCGLDIYFLIEQRKQTVILLPD